MEREGWEGRSRGGTNRGEQQRRTVFETKVPYLESDASFDIRRTDDIGAQTNRFSNKTDPEVGGDAMSRVRLYPGLIRAGLMTQKLL